MKYIKIFVIIFLIFSIRLFIICPYKISTSAMEPTLHGDPKKGDKLLSNQFIYYLRNPKRGEIVLFKTDGIKDLSGNKVWVKRVVGLPGETLYIKDNSVYINNEKLTSPDIFKSINYLFKDLGTGKYQMKYGNEKNPITIPEDCYFVLGDNTYNSKDSRYFGFVPEKNIIGKASLVYWPPKNFKKI